MIIVSQNRQIIVDSPTQIDYEDGIIGCFRKDGNIIELGVYELEITPLVFEKIIEAYKNGEKVFEMPEVY